MRPDMPHIAVERPRYGHGDRYPRGRLRTHEGRDPEQQPFRESLSWRRYGTKGFSDNLAPLYRFLRGSVGRPWNAVWSELCAHVSFDNPVQRHILGHVFGVVVADVELRGKEPYALANRGRAVTTPLRGTGRWPTLYICPRSGLLKQAKHVRRSSRRAVATNPNVVPLAATDRLHRVAGLWYRETTARDEAGALLVVAKRQLGTRELRQLGLMNEAP